MKVYNLLPREGGREVQGYSHDWVTSARESADANARIVVQINDEHLTDAELEHYLRRLAEWLRAEGVSKPISD
jgi:hypothetical protein